MSNNTFENFDMSSLSSKSRKTLAAIFLNPVSGNIKWRNIEGLLKELGAEVEERSGSRVGVILFGQIKVFHRPHPTPDTNKGAVVSVRKWLKENGVDYDP